MPATLSDGTAIRHTFPAGTVVGPGCAVVVFGGGHPPTNLFSGAIVQVASTGLLGLHNGNPQGDANGNGIVNVDDLLVVINGWGPCP